LLGELNEATIEGVGLHTVVVGEFYVVSQFVHAYSYGDSSRAHCERGRIAEKLTVSDLQRGTFEKAEAEEIGAVQQSVEGSHGSVGGASDGGVVWVFRDAELARDQRQDLVSKKFGKEFAVRLGCGEHRIGVWDVFVTAAFAWTVDAYDDDRFDGVGGDEAGESFVDLPLVVKAGCAGIEEIFAVHHVEDRVAFLCIGWIVVSRGKPDAEGLRVSEDCAGEGSLLQFSDDG
jgi:hypothetical protein